jgi:hypothetical protein
MALWEDRARHKTVKNTADVLPFSYLSSIERLSLSIANVPKFRWRISKPPVPSNLKTLDLTHIRQKCLGELLSGTPNLTTLEWLWYYDLGVRDEFITSTVELDKVPYALSPVRSILTDLTLKAESRM